MKGEKKLDEEYTYWLNFYIGYVFFKELHFWSIHKNIFN